MRRRGVKGGGELSSDGQRSLELRVHEPSIITLMWITKTPGQTTQAELLYKS